jgi:hypothetical protein
MVDPKRVAPVIVAAAFATVYVIVSPPSLDLAAHALRAKLFSTEGFGIWNNWWYAGHHILGYSVLFPAAAAALSPQLGAGIAATGTAALFEPLARARFGERAWLGSVWFAAATATNLFTGRLAFAFGLLPAVAAALALARGRPWLASLLAVLAALASPVAALFTALAGAACAVAAYAVARVGGRRVSDARATRPTAGVLAGLAVAVAALTPVLVLAVAFPEGGTEPFTFATLWPIALIAIALVIALPADARTLRAGVVLYALACIASYAIATPVGSNAARLGTLVAGPVAALALWPKRRALLALLALPLLYLQWQAPVRDVRTASGDPSHSAASYRPLLGFLSRQSGPPFRVEIPFTQFHWEAYEVAPRFPIPRGWERQLDIKYNRLFYGAPLTPASYGEWLHHVAVRFVAVSDAHLDYSAHAETALIRRGLPYLKPVFHSRHWEVYAVGNATPIASGAARLLGLGPSELTLQAARPGRVLVRVRFTPYWALAEGAGCVAPAGDFTLITLRTPGRVRLVTRFALGRIGAHAPRCT